MCRRFLMISDFKSILIFQLHIFYLCQFYLQDSAKRLEPITKLPLKELLAKLKSGEYSAQDVLTAYQIKVQYFNCLNYTA